MLGQLRVRRMAAGRYEIVVSKGYAEAARIATDEQRRAFALTVANLVPDLFAVTSLRLRAHQPDEYPGFVAVVQTINEEG